MVSVLLSVGANVNRASPKVPAGRDSVAHRVHHMGNSAHALLPLETAPPTARVVVRILKNRSLTRFRQAPFHARLCPWLPRQAAGTCFVR
jgi:hypothetical protein